MMESYECICVVGEGSYGVVMKCRHKQSGQIVAIKKFIDTEDDYNIRKMALREIKMLKKLHHDNLVNMIEVFRRKKRFYLVFEYIDHTVLDELEENPKGLGEKLTREHIFQVIRGIDFCHKNKIVHRDVKPENILVSKQGVIKLCDFGFARTVSSGDETYTDYVATRWYRAPELLVGDTKYGPPVDIWAIGCLFTEMMSGDPLFPGDSDIDQIHQIIKVLGRLCSSHLQLISKTPLLKDMKTSLEHTDDFTDPSRCLYKLFPTWSHLSLDFASSCLRLDPLHRSTTFQLLDHSYLTHDKFSEVFLPALKSKIEYQINGNPLLKKVYFQHLIASALETTDCQTRHTSQNEALQWKINCPKAISKAGGKQRALKDIEKVSLNRTGDCISPMETVEGGGFKDNIRPARSKNCSLLRASHTSVISISPFKVPTTVLQPAVNTLTFSHTFRNNPSKEKREVIKAVPRTDDVLHQRNRGKNNNFTLPELPRAPSGLHKLHSKKLNLLSSTHGTLDPYVSPKCNSRVPSISPSISSIVSNLPFV